MDVTSLVLPVGGAVAVTLAFLVIVFSLMFLVLRATARRSAESARQQYPGARLIDAGANFFGQQSRGVGQLRGNGTLILTDSELIFQQWVTNREFRIPLSGIQSIETPSSFLGKTQGVPLLKINFTGDDGRLDAMAWRVRDLSGMMRAIDEARGAG